MSLYTQNKCPQNSAGICFNTCVVRPTSSPHLRSFTQDQPKYRTTQRCQTHNPAVAASLTEMHLFPFCPFPMEDCKKEKHAPMVQTHRHTMIKFAHHQGLVPVLQYGPFGLHGPLFGRLDSKSRSKAGPTDHPLFCDKSNCLQQEIPSAPPNDPSSILGHFAVRIHSLTEHLRMDHLSLPRSQPGRQLRHQDVGDLKILTPENYEFAHFRGKVPRT